MDPYDEYSDRIDWQQSEKFHLWNAKRILGLFIKKANLDIESTDLLEIGIGTGRIGQAARGINFHSYFGIEPNLRLAEIARQKGLTVLSDAALPNLPLEFENTFSGVISVHVLEHAPTYIDARQWCEEMKRVSSVGGSVAIACPDIRDYRSHFWDSDWSHGYPTSPQRIAQLMEDVGFQIQYRGSIHLGSTSRWAAAIAHIISLLIPTRIGDMVSVKLVGRPLVSGLKISLLWGLAFVVGTNSTPSLSQAKGEE